MEGSRTPTPFGSRPCTDCSSGRSRTPRWSAHPVPVHPCWPLLADTPPILPTPRSRTTSLATLPCPPACFHELWLIEQTTLDGPAPSLRPRYRGFITTTTRSASTPRVGTQHLAVSAAWCS